LATTVYEALAVDVVDPEIPQSTVLKVSPTGSVGEIEQLSIAPPEEIGVIGTIVTPEIVSNDPEEYVITGG
jgi:hypothetical protein